jgi:hypothetical protein
MQESLKHMTADELKVYIKYAEQFKVKDFCASILGHENIQLDMLLRSADKTASRRKSATKK